MVFTNKHVVIALIVAPVLAVLAWFATGQLASEAPQAAIPGQAYPLLESSNCRYPSGACDLENEDFRLRLRAVDDDAGELLLSSRHPLEGVVLDIGLPNEEYELETMRSVDGLGLEWRLALASRPAADQRIRLVALAGGSRYFAEASTAFLQPRDDSQRR